MLRAPTRLDQGIAGWARRNGSSSLRAASPMIVMFRHTASIIRALAGQSAPPVDVYSAMRRQQSRRSRQLHRESLEYRLTELSSLPHDGGFRPTIWRVPVERRGGAQLLPRFRTARRRPEKEIGRERC